VEAAGNGGNRNNANPGYRGAGFNLNNSTLDASRTQRSNPTPQDCSEYKFTQDVVRFANPFLPGAESSGAVLVGAGSGGYDTPFVNGVQTPNSLSGKATLLSPNRTNFGIGPYRSRLSFSNYGSRVDVNAWGQNTASTASSRCELFGSKSNKNRCYTSTFSGTSGASAIMAGIIASTQGIVRANGTRLLNSTDYISLFRNPASGDPQAQEYNITAIRNIGNRADMAKLVPLALALAKTKR
jgi:hypothetical protein